MSSHSQQRVAGPLSQPNRGHIGEIHSTNEDLIEVMSQLASTLRLSETSNQTPRHLAGFIDYYRRLCEEDLDLKPGRRFRKGLSRDSALVDAIDAMKAVDARRPHRHVQIPSTLQRSLKWSTPKSPIFSSYFRQNIEAGLT